ncbi:MAG: ABC transporter permease [Pseudomonadota bacterium]
MTLGGVVEIVDEEELARARSRKRQAIARYALPVVVLIIVLGGWHLLVTVNEIPHYILPGPDRVFSALVENWASLIDSWWVTITITFLALSLAISVGVGLAVLFNLSKWVELSFFPYAVVLQVTPIVAIAPLIFIYADRTVGLLICAWIVAFFPILSNTVMGLNSSDHNLRDLFQVYGASRWQKLRFLEGPSALPYFLSGLRIAGGLSLIGAVVAEFVAGTGGIGSGLAFRILEASYRLQVPKMFAALFLIIVTGIAIYLLTSFLSHMLLRKWHESAVRREG